MSKPLALLLVLLGAICFGTTGTFQALAPKDANPWVIGEARMIVGSLSLAAWCLLLRKFPKNWKDLPWKYILLCTLCIVCYQPLFFFSIRNVGVAVGTVIAIGSTPVWTAILSMVLYKKVPGIIWWIATFLAIVGIVHFNASNLQKSISLVNCILPVFAGLSYAGLLTFSPKVMERLSSEAAMMIIMALTALCLAPVLFIYPLDWIWTKQGFLVCLGIGIVSVGMAFGLFMSGLNKVGSVVASTLGLAEPVTAVILGILFLHEPISRLDIGGFHLLFASLLLLLITECLPSRRNKVGT